MGQVVLYSLLAAFNPTLVAATTVMLLLAHPSRLMLGYYLGAMMTSITLGLVIVFAFESSSTTSTTKNTLSPAADLALGAILVALALTLATGRDKGFSERRAQRRQDKPDKGPPKWQRALSGGSARTTFVVGALLTLPGAAYLAGLHHIDELDYATVPTVLLVVGFNMVMMILLEAPLAAFLVAPAWTPGAIERAKAWVGDHARSFAIYGLGGVGGLLICKGIVELL